MFRHYLITLLQPHHAALDTPCYRRFYILLANAVPLNLYLPYPRHHLRKLFGKAHVDIKLQKEVDYSSLDLLVLASTLSSRASRSLSTSEIDLTDIYTCDPYEMAYYVSVVRVICLSKSSMRHKRGMKKRDGHPDRT